MGKSGEFTCDVCGAFCQGFQTDDGDTYCADCYYKEFGEWPWDAEDWDEED